MSLLRPGDNVWQVARAARAAVLIDAAAFFATVRKACLKAERDILIAGWDIDSRTPLVGEGGSAADGYPASFADFLAELVRARPWLSVHLLLWDYSLLYAGERELLPRLSLQWRMPERIGLRLDNSVPFGCSQHQKLVVIDDSLAFSGGLDLTIRRWDTPDHAARNGHRVDPAGRPYRPFHDVQMMVDGDAAHALALLARQRWCRVEGGQPVVEPVGDPWPEEVTPDFHGASVGIARTQPGYQGEPEIREVEALFVDAIDAAERFIYIENQFLTAPLIARRLARQLRRKPGLEVVIVAPRSHDSWIERRTMRNGRIRFWRALRKAGGERVALLYPAVEQDGRITDTMVHSKVMVVDDRFLRIGSANLNNRSMGVDTECDLAIDASNAAERAGIAAIRNRLVGEHCGVAADVVAAELARVGSLARVSERLSADGHRLRPIQDGRLDRHPLAALVERIADPARPPRLRQWTARALTRLVRPSAPVMAIGVLLLLVVALALAWRFTDLSRIAAPERLGEWLSAAGNGPWTAIVVGPGIPPRRLGRLSRRHPDPGHVGRFRSVVGRALLGAGRPCQRAGDVWRRRPLWPAAVPAPAGQPLAACARRRAGARPGRGGRLAHGSGRPLHAGQRRRRRERHQARRLRAGHRDRHGARSRVARRDGRSGGAAPLASDTASAGDPRGVRRAVDRAGILGAGAAVAPGRAALLLRGRRDRAPDDLEHPRRARPQSALRSRSRGRTGETARARHRRPAGDRFAAGPRRRCRQPVRRAAARARRPCRRRAHGLDCRRRLRPGPDQPLAARPAPASTICPGPSASRDGPSAPACRRRPGRSGWSPRTWVSACASGAARRSRFSTWCGPPARRRRWRSATSTTGSGRARCAAAWAGRCPARPRIAPFRPVSRSSSSTGCFCSRPTRW